MKDSLEILKDINGGIKRDLLYLISGFLMLLILNFLYSPNIVSYPNFNLLGTFGFVATIITLSFFLSWFCNRLGFEIKRILGLLFTKNPKKQINSYWDRFKRLVNRETENTGSGNMITMSELEYFISNNPGLFSLVERRVQGLIFFQSFMGFSILLSIFYSSLFIIPSAILTVIAFMQEVDIREIRVDIAKFLNYRHRSSK